MHSDRYFKTEHLKHNLKERIIRGLIAVFSGRGILLVIETIGTMILARLLFPADYGLIAMVAVVVNFVIIFRDMGLSSATIWAENISQQIITNMFWISILIGIILTIIVAALAPVIAWFYREPRLMRITWALLPSFIFSSAMLQHQALLRRQMRFGRLALSQLIASGGGIVIAISCALKGMGYWSLVAQRVSGSFLMLVMIWSVCHWKPGLPRKCNGTGQFLHFGGNLSGSRLVQYLMRNADNMILGYFSGSTALGIYSKAYALLMLPLKHINEPFTSVVVPALSRLQGEPERYRNYYKKAISAVTTISIPIAVFSAIAARDIIQVILGAKWSAASVVFIFLVPLAFLGSFNVSTGWVYISLGRVSRQLRMHFVTGILGLISMFIGVRWGVYGMAAAVSIISIICWFPQMLYCFHGTPLAFKDLASALYRQIAAAVISALIILAAAIFLPFSGPGLLSLIVKLLGFGSIYCLLYIIFPGGRDVVKQYSELFVKSGK